MKCDELFIINFVAENQAITLLSFCLYFIHACLHVLSSSLFGLALWNVLCQLDQTKSFLSFFLSVSHSPFSRRSPLLTVCKKSYILAARNEKSIFKKHLGIAEYSDPDGSENEYKIDSTAVVSSFENSFWYAQRSRCSHAFRYPSWKVCISLWNRQGTQRERSTFSR